MTPPRKSVTVEGEVVRKVWDFEYDYIEIDGVDLQDVLERAFGEGTLKEIRHSEREFRWGRLRITIEEAR